MNKKNIGKFTELFDSRLSNSVDSADSGTADIQLATAILMFEVVKADLKIDRSEMAELMEILRQQFKLDDRGLGRILELAGDASMNLESVTTIIREEWNSEQRLKLLKYFWVIAVADEDIDERETALIDRIAQLLELNSDDITAAKNQAEQVLQATTQAAD